MSCYVAELGKNVGELSGEEREQAAEWLAWCEAQLDDRNPMRRSQMPKVPTVKSHERERLVQDLARQVAQR